MTKFVLYIQPLMMQPMKQCALNVSSISLSINGQCLCYHPALTSLSKKIVQELSLFKIAKVKQHNNEIWVKWSARGAQKKLDVLVFSYIVHTAHGYIQ